MRRSVQIGEEEINMKKRIRAGLVTIMMVLCLVACGSNATPLAEVFVQEELEQQTAQIVEWLNAEEYEKVYETFREDMKEALPVEELKAACEETYGNAGSQVQVSNIVVNGQRIEEEEYATVMLKVEYEQQIVTFQVGYDSNMEVVGLYMK